MHAAYHAEVPPGENGHDAIPDVPFLIIPAQGLSVQGGIGPTGTRQVQIALTNPVARATFPLDLEQAHEHVQNVQRAILEAQGAELPPQKKLVTPT